jgi:hypothetical protein
MRASRRKAQIICWQYHHHSQHSLGVRLFGLSSVAVICPTYLPVRSVLASNFGEGNVEGDGSGSVARNVGYKCRRVVFDREGQDGKKKGTILRAAAAMADEPIQEDNRLRAGPMNDL